MMSGQQALRAVEQTAAQLRGEEARVSQALRGAEEESARLRGDRLAALRDLASVKLDAIQRDTLVAELGAVERRALQLISERRRALNDLASAVDKARQDLEAAQAARHAALSNVTSTLEALETLQAGVEPEVRASAAWADQAALVREAEAVAAASDAKALASEADRDAKRVPYETDRLFMYLWSRGYGTSAYRAGSIVRFFDGKVARLIQFDGARPNYTMLIEIPKRLREHADRCRADVEEARARLVAIERNGLLAAGSEPLEAAHAKAGEALAAAERKVEDAQAALDRAEKEHGTASPGEHDAYQDAIAMIVQAADRTDVQGLYREAARTPTPEDDRIVRRIEQLEGGVRQAENQATTLRRQYQDVVARRQQVEMERDSIRRQGWDNPMGQFSNDRAINDILSGIVQGAVQGAVLGNVLKGGYSQRPPRADSGFGGSGGFTLPPFGDGGSSGGDGFRTGGSF